MAAQVSRVEVEPDVNPEAMDLAVMGEQLCSRVISNRPPVDLPMTSHPHPYNHCTTPARCSKTFFATHTCPFALSVC